MAKVTAGEVIDLLNNLLENDADAVNGLFRVSVPGKFGKRPVGLLGIVNNLVGPIENGPYRGWGQIMAVTKDDRIVRFDRTGGQFD